jgi:hypothetical protein
MGAKFQSKMKKMSLFLFYHHPQLYKMKRIIFYLIGFTIAISSNAQNKELESVSKMVEIAHKAIFVQKDSITLEKIFAKEITYGHSGGKLENRKEAIENIAHNQSVYSDISIDSISVLINGNTAVSRYILKGDELNKSNKLTHLHLNILMTWIKENKQWKMMARQATKI